MYNPNSLDTLCAALCYAMGIDKPEFANCGNANLTKYIDETLAGQKADRIFMYNPDANASKYKNWCEANNKSIGDLFNTKYGV